MSLARRLALIGWAERHGAAIVEDDYDSELRFDGRPLEPLQSLDRSGRVLYVGTFSKVLLPGLRLGFIVDGLFTRHLRRVLRDYRARRTALLDALAHHLGDRVVVLPSSAGLHVSAWPADRRADDVSIAAAARAAGVAVEPLSGYFVRAGRPGLALGFGLIHARQIDAGIRALAGVMPTRRERPGGRSRRP